MGVKLQVEKEIRDQKIEKLKKINKPLFERIEKYEVGLWDNNLKEMNYKKLMNLLEIVNKIDKFNYYEKLSSYSDSNFCEFAKLYFNQIDESYEELYRDLVYMQRFGFIQVIIDEDSKNDAFNNDYFLDVLELIIKADNTRNRSEFNFKAIICFSKKGELIYKNEYHVFSLNESIENQKAIKEEMLQLKSLAKSLDNKINNYTKEIISVVAIIVAIAPIITINISQISNLNISELLIINGALLAIITSIFGIIKIAFFDLRKQDWVLLCSIIIAGLIILLGYLKGTA